MFLYLLCSIRTTSRIHAKIDKVGGVVETNRPDAKNSLYQDAIKKGDQLLNRIQVSGSAVQPHSGALCKKCLTKDCLTETIARDKCVTHAETCEMNLSPLYAKFSRLVQPSPCTHNTTSTN